MHPRHPDHPDYEELRAAGRAGSAYHRTDSTIPAQRESNGCRDWSEDRDGSHVCDAPAPFVIARSDGRGVHNRFCDTHARALLGREVPFSSRPGARVYWIVAAFKCTSCDVIEQYRSQLDHDGRCHRCTP